jgi:hypothetical protein
MFISSLLQRNNSCDGRVGHGSEGAQRKQQQW